MTLNTWPKLMEPWYQWRPSNNDLKIKAGPRMIYAGVVVWGGPVMRLHVFSALLVLGPVYGGYNILYGYAPQQLLKWVTDTVGKKTCVQILNPVLLSLDLFLYSFIFSGFPFLLTTLPLIPNSISPFFLFLSLHPPNSFLLLFFFNLFNFAYLLAFLCSWPLLSWENGFIMNFYSSGKL